MKHTRTSRLLSLLLTALMLLCSVACADTDTDDETVAQATDAVTEAETVDPNYTCDLPDGLDYGTEINFLYTDLAQRSEELISEEYALGVISDSVYERNASVCQKLGVTMAYTSRVDEAATYSTISSLVKAGDTSVDIVTGGAYCCMAPIQAGCLLNLNTVANMDLSKHYWNQDFNEMMTFTSENLQYVATSPIAISIFRNGYLTIFNRDKMEEYQLPDLYEVVNSGEWTLDYQYSLIKDIYTDENGDGKVNKGDFYGLIIGDQTDMDVYAVSSNVHPVVRDENGDLYYDADTFEKLVEITEKVSLLCHTPGTYLAVCSNEGYNVPIEDFVQKKAVMATTMFGSVESNIEYLSDISYGIAPIPKLTKEQESYGTYIQDQVSCFGISAAITDTDRQGIVGAVMEAMSYYSYVIVRPAYYDVALSLRFMQDPQSKAILDTMFESISFDFTYVTGLGGVRDSLRPVLSAQNPAIASQAKKWERLIESALTKQSKALDKLKEAS